MMSSKIRKRGDLREEGNLGELIKRFTNDPPNTVDLQTRLAELIKQLTNDPLNTVDLQTLLEEHGQLTDPEKSQAKVNDFFHK